MSNRFEQGARRMPWPHVPPTLENVRNPPREYGILPFWFLNGALDPEEMRWQLRELRDKGLPGTILHGRFGLELTYLGPAYRDRTRLAVEENGERAGVRLWPPYEGEIADRLRPGDNTLELRVANTVINLLEAIERPSGLAGPPRLVPYRRVTFAVPD